MSAGEQEPNVRARERACGNVGVAQPSLLQGHQQAGFATANTLSISGAGSFVLEDMASFPESQTSMPSSRPSAKPFSAVQPIDLATQLPPTWFNSIRNEENRLDSSPVPLQFRLTKPLADKVEAEVQALVRQQSVSANDAILRVMQSCMKVDVVYYDGQPVTIFCPDSAVHETLVPAPQIVSAEFLHPQRSLTVRAEKRPTRPTRATAKPQPAAHAEPTAHCSDCAIVQVYVTRKLPLSSAHANRFFRLGFLWMGHGVEHVLFTRAISVLAKQAPGAERKQKYFASHKAEPSRTCWILQRAASSRGMDLSKSFESACAPAPMGVGGYKRARGGEALSRNSASFARVAAGECSASSGDFKATTTALSSKEFPAAHVWDRDECVSVCVLSDPALPACDSPRSAPAQCGAESDDTASDARSVSPFAAQDDCAASVAEEMWCVKANADAAAAASKPCGDPLARFFRQGRSVPAPVAMPCHIPSVSRCASPLPPLLSSGVTPYDLAVPPRHTPHQAPVIASQPAAIQAVSTPLRIGESFSQTLKPLFQVPTPPASMGEFVGLSSGLADMARQDSLERGHSLVGGDDLGSHGGLPFADLLAMAPSQDASVPDLARSYSARSAMSVGSGFNFGGQ